MSQRCDVCGGNCGQCGNYSGNNYNANRYDDLKTEYDPHVEVGQSLLKGIILGIILLPFILALIL